MRRTRVTARVEIVKGANLTLRFVLEVCVLAALVYWGIHVGQSRLMQVDLAVGAPLVVAAVWGIFGAPAAPVSLSGPIHLLLEVAVFGAGVAAVATGRPALAVAFALVIVANRALMDVWGQ